MSVDLYLIAVVFFLVFLYGIVPLFRLFSQRTPVSVVSTSQTISLSMDNKQADAGRDCKARLAKPNVQARTGTGKYLFSLFFS